MKKILRVVSQTQAVSVQRQDGTQTQKCALVLQELGGQYQNAYAATLFGNQVRFYQNDLVTASLRFSAREHNGNYFQDVTINEIRKLA